MQQDPVGRKLPFCCPTVLVKTVQCLQSLARARVYLDVIIHIWQRRGCVNHDVRSPQATLQAAGAEQERSAPCQAFSRDQRVSRLGAAGPFQEHTATSEPRAR